jgi:RNase adaptor protein for sRNA GlmZ degradation
MSLSEAIALEADKLRDIRDRAKYIIDTSTYNAKPVRQDRIAFRRKTAKG